MARKSQWTQSNNLISLPSSFYEKGPFLADAKKSALVFGNGALGSGLASDLLRCGWQVAMVGRQGLVLADFELRDEAGVVRCHTKKHSATAVAECRLAILAVRAGDFLAASSMAVELLNDNGSGENEWRERPVIVALGNGLTGEEVRRRQKEFPDILWRVGMSTLGVTEISPRQFVKNNRNPRTVWGALDPTLRITGVEVQALADFSGGVWQPDAVSAVQQKWLFSTALNSLCGVYRLPCNGLALEYREVLWRLFNEAFRLGEQRFGVWSKTSEELWQDLERLVVATASNENSMARDVRLGRETETDYLAGLAVGEYDFPLLKIFHGVLSR